MAAAAISSSENAKTEPLSACSSGCACSKESGGHDRGWRIRLTGVAHSCISEDGNSVRASALRIYFFQYYMSDTCAAASLREGSGVHHALMAAAAIAAWRRHICRCHCGLKLMAA